jgi:primary-amine oxidase
VIQETQLTNETVDYLDPLFFTSWRIFNKVIRNQFGRLRGYELIPTIRGKGYGIYDTAEPWSSGELWVTRYNQCHLLATNNHPPLIRDTCAGTADNLTEMVAGAGNIDGVDIVVWYANRFSFQTRDEDQPNLPIQWTGFDIKPRSFHHIDPMFQPE